MIQSEKIFISTKDHFVDLRVIGYSAGSGGIPVIKKEGWFLEDGEIDAIRKVIVDFLQKEKAWQLNTKDVDGNRYPLSTEYYQGKKILQQIQRTTQS